LERIAIYCEKDTFTVAQIYLRLKGMDIMPQEAMIKV